MSEGDIVMLTNAPGLRGDCKRKLALRTGAEAAGGLVALSTGHQETHETAGFRFSLTSMYLLEP